MAFHATREQRHALQLFAQGDSMRIEALAGCGKSTTLRYLAGTARRKILYTAFGAKVIQDAKSSFPAGVRVATNHALAWGVGRRYQGSQRLRSRVGATDLVRHFGWTDAAFAPFADAYTGAHAVLEAIARFCHSGADTLERGHALSPATRRAGAQGAVAVEDYTRIVVERAREAWEEMTRPQGTLPVTHDVYLKQWALTQPELNYDVVMLDEAQDANGVILRVLSDQVRPQLVLVGDRHQAIFGWRGAVNAFDRLRIPRQCRLTQSFRFGPEIAELANLILSDQCQSTLLLQGDPAQPGRIGPVAQPDCVLARKNATLISYLFERLKADPGAKVAIQGGAAELLGLLEGAARLQSGRPAGHPELADFADWQEVRDGIDDEHFSHLRTLVDLVSTYGVGRLRAALQDACVPAGQGILTLSTAHKAKGAEWERVKLLDDFPLVGPPSDPEAFGWDMEAANLLYVAATRARRELDVEDCGAVQQALAQSRTQAIQVAGRLVAQAKAG